MNDLKLEQVLQEVEQTLTEMARGNFLTAERCAIEARYLLRILEATREKAQSA